MPVDLTLASFPSAMQIQVQIDFTVNLSADNTKITVSDTLTEWRVTDIGLIKTSELIQSQAAGITFTENETWELVGYRVKDSAAGLLSNFTLADNLASASSSTGTPGQAGVASDGSNYLVVSCRESSSGLPAGVIGLFVDENGVRSQAFTIAEHSCYEFSATAAFDGSNYLVVFQRYTSANSGSPEIFAARVTPAGEVLDAAPGIVIASGNNGSQQPVVAYDGSNYLVVYSQYADTTLWNIVATRINPAGQIIDKVSINADNGDQTSPAILFDGRQYMVAWENTATGSGPSLQTDIYAARITPEGMVLDPAGIAIATAPAYQGDAQIAFDGSNYLISWRNVDSFFIDPPVSAIYSRQVTTDGNLLDAPADTMGLAVNTIALPKDDLAVVFNGVNYLLIWRMGAFASDPPSGIYAARVSTAGTLLDTPANSNGIPVTGSPPDFSRYLHPTVLFNGKNALLTWLNNKELSGNQKSLQALFLYPF